MVATHGFGFDEELRAAERARDVVPDRVGSVMDHRDVHAALVLMRIEQGEHADHHRAGDHHQQIHARAGRDAGRDGPEQVQQVHRILHGGTVTHDGQRAHHTKRDHDVRADGQCDHAGEHAHAHQRHREAARIHDARVEPPVYAVDDDAHQQRHQQGQRHFGHVVLAEGVQHRFLDHVAYAHGFAFSFAIVRLLRFLRFPMFSAARFRPSVFGLPRYVRPVRSSHTLGTFQPSCQ